MTQYVTKFQGSEIDLSTVANTYTKVFGPTNRNLLHLQNDSAFDAKIYFDSDPFCLSCDGGDHVAINGVSTDTTLVAATKGKISARIRLTAVGVTDRTIFSIADTSANEYIRLYVTTAGKLKAELRTAAAEQWNIVLSTAFVANQWYRVKLIHDGTTPKLFVDGSEWAKTLTATTDATVWFSGLSNLDNARIASLNTNAASEADQFVGLIDWVEVVTGTDDDRDFTVIAQYPINEGTGTTLDDKSGNTHDGTFGGGGAAPSWDVKLSPIILGAGADQRWETAVPSTGVYMFVESGASGTLWNNEGLYVANAPMGA